MTGDEREFVTFGFCTKTHNYRRCNFYQSCTKCQSLSIKYKLLCSPVLLYFPCISLCRTGNGMDVGIPKKVQSFCGADL